MTRRFHPLLLAGLLGLAAGCSARGGGEPVWVGHVATFTGPDKAAGEQARQGIELAVREVNDSPERLFGRRVAVRQADARAGSERAQEEAVRLLSVNRVAALLGGTDPVQAERLARAAQEVGVPLVAQSGLPPAAVNDYTFSSSISPARRGQALARYATQELKISRVALAADSRSAYATACADAFMKEMAAAVTPRLDYKDQAEFVDWVSRVGKARPQGLFLAGSASDLARLRAELRKPGVELPVLFAGGEGSLSALLADPEGGHGVFVLTPYLADADTAQNQEFVRAYRERFHEAPDAYAALAYDGARLLFDALRRAKGQAAGKLREELTGVTDFDSLTGPVALDRKDHQARRPVFVVEALDGKAVQRKRYGPDLP